jgi:hypothetical protein
MIEHTFVKARQIVPPLVAVVVAAAIGVGIGLPVPTELPGVALGSTELLRAERSLAFLYAFLLVLVPLARGLQGQLPIELSTRGARWQESTAASEGAIRALDRRVDASSYELDQVNSELLALGERLARLEEGEGGVH